MAPAAKLDLAGRVRIALRVIPGILDLAEQEGRIVDAEVDAIAVTLLRIPGAGPSLIAIEDAAKNGQLLSDIHQKPGSHGSQGRRRTAAGQIKRGDRRPAHRGVGQDVGIFGIEELAVGRELSHFERDFLAAPLLFKIRLVKTRGRQCLDAADDQIVL
ncbi:hypothetical protein MA20_32750 [Bradyrhizobium japonicum]|uniref:Uncharacterized protein n=1 Tax=Bradyrhizobium japonicum TaxID=375 RepID=A0A0A3XQ43_BRAJP|nr:hypothetical protein MA20_32750 [Bradyrhizobium japonicum]